MVWCVQQDGKEREPAVRRFGFKSEVGMVTKMFDGIEDHACCGLRLRIASVNGNRAKDIIDISSEAYAVDVQVGVMDAYPVIH